MAEEKLLDGKTVVITGTARGIGHQMAVTFAENGANLFVHARNETDEHRSFCENLAEKTGKRVIPVYFDLADEEEIKAGITRIRAEKLQIDGLVNNAGITHIAMFQMTRLNDVREQFAINFFAPFLLTQYISKLMVRNRKGSIVNISSMAALHANAGRSAYGSSKAALLCMTRCIASELGVYGIRANAICPGVIRTDMLETMSEEVLRTQKNAVALRSFGKTSDVANMAMFLLSDYAGYITGQVIRVDGGMSGSL